MLNKIKVFGLSVSSIIVGLVILLVLVQLVISHSLATQGKRVYQLELKAEEIERENDFLKEEIAKSGSLSRIAQKAKELDLVKANQVLYLVPQVPVALGR